MTADSIIEAKALPLNMSAQKAKLVALTRALELSQGKKVNIWTDSKYTFSILHAHGAIWKERGLLTSKGIKHSNQIIKLLEAIQLPVQVAVMHCKAHQKKDNDDIIRGNQLADKVAKEADNTGIIPEKVSRVSDQKPHYGEQDKKFND